jgi:hypothetical protein
MITLSILLQSHCDNSSMFLVPTRCLLCVLVPRLLFTRHWTKTVTAFISHLELAENYFELNWLRIFPESRYMASAPTAQKTQLCCWLALTAQKTSHMAAIVARRLTAAEMCLPLYCIATREAGWGAATLSTVTGITQQRAINTRTSIVVWVFRGFCFSTVPARRKHATISILLTWSQWNWKLNKVKPSIGKHSLKGPLYLGWNHHMDLWASVLHKFHYTHLKTHTSEKHNAQKTISMYAHIWY